MKLIQILPSTVTFAPIKMINSPSSDDGDGFEYDAQADDAAVDNVFGDSFDKSNVSQPTLGKAILPHSLVKCHIC